MIIDNNGEFSKILFIVGAPRSGTTWLQLLLSQHEEIATVQETHLFNTYLSCFERYWHIHKTEPRPIGLQAVFNEDEFYEFCKYIAKCIFKKIKKRNPRATILLEKTPAHIQSWPLILKLFPEAYFINVIRDPRSVVCSMRFTGRQWKNFWASQGIIDLSKRWLHDVKESKALQKEAMHYKEIKYEKLHKQGPKELKNIFDWLEISISEKECAKIFEKLSFEKVKAHTTNIKQPWEIEKEPKSFFRKGKINSWREDLSKLDITIIESITFEEMIDHGYNPLSKKKKFLFKTALYKLLEIFDWRFNRAIKRFKQKL